MVDQGLTDRLTEIEQTYGEVEGLLADPAVLGDRIRYSEVSALRRTPATGPVLPVVEGGG